MASLRHIRRRIISVRNTQQITRAMKMVAAARLRRAQETVLAARPFSDRMGGVVSSLALRAEPEHHPLLIRNDSIEHRLLVVTADRGLCGGFNANIVREVQDFIRGVNEEPVSIAVVGRKGRDGLRSRQIPIVDEYVNVFTRLSYDHAVSMGEKIIEDYLSGAIGDVTIIYNHFVSTMRQRVTRLPLLPVVAPPHDDEEEAQTEVDFIYEPSPDGVLSQLLRRHVIVQIYRALLESFAGEMAARMTAMDSATNNAAEMIAKLTLTFNRARQASITREIIEVVSGADALGG